MSVFRVIAVSIPFLCFAGQLNSQQRAPSIQNSASNVPPSLQLSLSKSVVGAGGEQRITVTLRESADIERNDLSVTIYCMNLGGKNFPRSLRVPIKPGQQQFIFSARIPAYFKHPDDCIAEARIRPHGRIETQSDLFEKQFQIVAGAQPPEDAPELAERQYPLTLKLISVKTAEVTHSQLLILRSAEQEIREQAVRLHELIRADMVTDAELFKIQGLSIAALRRSRGLLLRNTHGQSEDQPRHIDEFIGDLMERLSELLLRQEVEYVNREQYVVLATFDPQTPATSLQRGKLAAPPLLAVLYDILRAIDEVNKSGSLVFSLRIETCPQGATVKYGPKGYEPTTVITNQGPLEETKARIYFDVTLKEMQKRSERKRNATFSLDFFRNPYNHVKVFCRPEVSGDDVQWFVE